MKQYQKPTMTVACIQSTSIICTSPGYHEEVGGGGQFSHRYESFPWEDTEGEKPLDS
jgi:hypothetical protein